MKTQLAYRDTQHIQNGFKTVITVGLSEVPFEAIPEEKKVLSLVGFEGSSAQPTSFVDLLSPFDPPDNEDYRAHDFGSLLHAQIWNVPAAHGSFQRFIRRTNIEPSEPGLAVMAFVGITSFAEEDTVDCDNIFQFRAQGGQHVLEGRIGWEVKEEWGVPQFSERMKGCGISSFLRDCTWGFGEEPIGLQSDMALDITEAMDRYRTLKLSGSDSDELEAAERKLMPHGLIMQYRDEEFVEFLKRRHERGMLFPSSHPITRSQIARVEEVSMEILREMIAEDEDDEIAPSL